MASIKLRRMLVVVWDAEAGLYTSTAVLVFTALYVAFFRDRAHQNMFHVLPFSTCKGFTHGTVAAF